jgi:hypothetical protein
VGEIERGGERETVVMDLIGKNKTVVEIDPDTRFKTKLNADDWLCVICNRKITSDKERFEYNNRNEFQFINPNGYSFDILTFSNADGCIEIGEPSLKFTWFAGHSWSYALCSH